MTDQPENAGADAPAAAHEAPTAATPVAGEPVPPPVPPPAFESDSPAAVVDEHPERAVGAAFAGGFALAMILKRLAR